MYRCVDLFNFGSLSSGNPLSLVDLVPLLHKTLKDDSSVTCKMACSAVRVRQICMGLPVIETVLSLTFLAVFSALHHDPVQQHTE